MEDPRAVAKSAKRWFGVNGRFGRLTEWPAIVGTVAGTVLSAPFHIRDRCLPGCCRFREYRHQFCHACML